MNAVTPPKKLKAGDNPLYKARALKEKLAKHFIGIGGVMVLASGDIPENIATALTEVQHDLFDLGGELCIPGSEVVTASDVERLERELDALNADLPPLKEFILPGGGSAQDDDGKNSDLGNDSFHGGGFNLRRPCGLRGDRMRPGLSAPRRRRMNIGTLPRARP